MIDVENLVYDYPGGRALHGVSFVARSGAVLALVGPNGAGKSTLMRCIAALDAPLDGVVTVLGHDTRRSPREVHAALGYLSDTFGLYESLSVRRSLVYAARSRGVARELAEDAAAEAAARVGLTARMDELAGTLSRGLRQRLAIAQAIVHRPRVLLLDEPASGLDPQARLSLSTLIRTLAGDGMTIVVSSHILAELEDYCTEMLMLNLGRVVGDGVVRAGAPLWSQAAGDGGSGATAPQTLGRAQALFSAPVPDLAERLAGLGLAVEEASGTRAVITLAAGPVAGSEALAKLVGAGLPLSSFAPIHPTLEQAYLAAAQTQPDQGRPTQDRPAQDRPNTAVPEGGA